VTTPYEFTTDTLVALLEEIARRDYGGHLTIFRFTTGWKCMLGTPWLERDVDPFTEQLTGDYADIWRLNHSDTLAGAVEACIDREQAAPLETESPIEALLAQAILAQPWGGMLKAQHRIGPYRADLALLDHRIVIECDGHAYHSTKEQRGHDAQRDRFIVAQGWRVLRCTGSEIHADVSKVVADIHAVVASL